MDPGFYHMQSIFTLSISCKEVTSLILRQNGKRPGNSNIGDVKVLLPKYKCYEGPGYFYIYA